MMAFGARSRQHGFTLLEVTVALAVIATAFTALLGLHARNIRLAARDQAYTRALFLARELIADAELGPFPEVGLANGDFETLYPGRYPDFRWERTVNDTALPSTREITVRVFPVADPAVVCELTLFKRDGT
jgi:general secretion pathway protein I